jgi:hypothetical protein
VTGLKLAQPVPLSEDCLRLGVSRTDPVRQGPLEIEERLAVKKRLQLAEQLLERVQVERFVSLPPTLRWGQNESHVFLIWKLSHRWDAPPCTSTQSQSLSHHFQGFTFSEDCIMSGTHYHYELNVTLWRAVSNLTVFYEGPHWIMRALKLDGGVWLYPMNLEVDYPLWKDLAEKYAETFLKYEELKDRAAEEKKARRRRRKKAAVGEQANPVEDEVSIDDL